jgi:hypothetical protein
MKAAILSLVTVAALAASPGTADARPPHYYGGNYHHGYYGNYNRPYYSGYYRPYSGGWGYNSGFGLNIVRPGGFGISIGTGGVYPYYGGYYGGSYYRPYYRGWRW